MNVRKILYATDFSPGGRFALDYASALASATNAKLYIVHVDDVTSGIVFGDIGYGYLPEVDKIAREHYEQLWQIRPTSANIAYEYRLLRGDAADEILQTAASVHANLIVIGTHGRSGLSRLLMGSVAEKIVRRATCPVLTVKRPGAESDDSDAADEVRERTLPS